MAVIWEASANSLLEQRDRFTQKAIKDEFETVFNIDLKAGLAPACSTSVAFDPQKKGYLTPVADQRYSVVWYLDDAEDDPKAMVHAVVPTTRFDTHLAGLWDRV